MKIIKRNGSEETFDIQKIVVAVTKADKDNGERTLTDSQIEDIAEYVEFKCNKLNRAVSVEEIQDMVENQIMATPCRLLVYPGRCPGRALKKVPNFKLHSLFLNFNSCPRSISSFKSGILFWTGI